MEHEHDGTVVNIHNVMSRLILSNGDYKRSEIWGVRNLTLRTWKLRKNGASIRELKYWDRRYTQKF